MHLHLLIQNFMHGLIILGGMSNENKRFHKCGGRRRLQPALAPAPPVMSWTALGRLLNPLYTPVSFSVKWE